MLTILLVVLIVVVVLGGGYGYSAGWYGGSPYYGPGIGIFGVVLLVLLVLLLLGRV